MVACKDKAMAKRVVVKDVFTGRRGVLDDSTFNSEMKRWSEDVQRLAKAEASLFPKGKRRNHTYKSGKKAGKTEQNCVTISNIS